MRILIIGEFSSFSKNLSAGFRALGHTCFVFSWGDGFKEIPIDGEGYQIMVPHEPRLPYPLRGFVYRIRCFFTFLKLKSYVNKMSRKTKWDAVLIINPEVIQHRIWNPFFTRKMVLSLAAIKDNVFLSACGGDLPYYDYWHCRNYKNTKMVALMKDKVYSEEGKRHFRYVFSFVRKTIPVMYDYAEAWRNSQYARQFVVYDTIPLPVDTSAFIPFNELSDKIVIFHGIIRPEAKGTKFIIAAMNRIQEKYPDRVECIAQGGMPLNEYLEVLKRTNILIDQTYSASSGMNGLYALAMGKVLLGGNEPENAVEFNYSNVPVINIRADENMIFERLEYLVLHPNEIIRLSKESREYVERVHDSKRIAARYIELFNYNINCNGNNK